MQSVYTHCRGSPDGTEVSADAKLRDSPPIEATVICRKEPSVFEGLYRLYTCCYAEGEGGYTHV